MYIISGSSIRIRLQIDMTQPTGDGGGCVMQCSKIKVGNGTLAPSVTYESPINTHTPGFHTSLPVQLKEIRFVDLLNRLHALISYVSRKMH